MRRQILAAAGVVASAVGLAALPGPPQVFRSSVDLVRVDVQVVTSDGHPMIGLTADDFEVGIDGDRRRVVSAELVKFTPEVDIINAVRPVRTPGEIPADTRVYVVAVDVAGFPSGEIQPLRQAVRRFMSQLRPQDLVALYAFPYRTPTLALTHDHRAVELAFDRTSGWREDRPGMFNLGASEIVDITAGDDTALQRVVRRECLVGDATCAKAIEGEASALASYLEAESVERLNAVSNLARSLATIPGRKTVVLLSAGLMSSTRTVGRPDVTGLISSVGTETANSQTNLYVLHWDVTWNDALGAAAPTPRRASDRYRVGFADRETYSRGLELIAGKAGGALFRVDGGSGDYVFDRVLRETTAYYLLGVEPTASDQNGKVHFISVSVRRPGATVRSRTQVVIPAK